MKIYKTPSGAVIEHNNDFHLKKVDDWDAFLNRTDLYEVLLGELNGLHISGDDKIFLTI